MAGKLILRTAFISLFFLGWASFVAASPKCYISFVTNEQKSSFSVILNNPTTEILFKNCFNNFYTYLPFTFDSKGKFYPFYKPRRRRWVGALLPVYMKRNVLEKFRFNSENTMFGLIPNNNYFFFTMAKVSSENDYIVSNYVVSNILSFHLNSKYQMVNTKVILWSDLPKVTQDSIKTFLQSYLTEMGVKASVDYVVSELETDKRNYKMPKYDPSVYKDAKIEYRKKLEEWLRSIDGVQNKFPKATNENNDESWEKRKKAFLKKWEEFGKNHTPIEKGEFIQNGGANTKR